MTFTDDTRTPRPVGGSKLRRAMTDAFRARQQPTPKDPQPPVDDGWYLVERDEECE